MLMTAKGGLLWFSAIGCGVMAGIYFIFSVSVMTSLSRADAETAVRVFNLINEDIVRSWFIPLFLSTSLAAFALAVLSMIRWGEPGTALIMAGSVIYLTGMLAVTMAANVPMNNELARLAAPATAVWASFAEIWTLWNHVRALASISAAILFTVALTMS